MATRNRAPKSSGPWYVLRETSPLSFVGQDPMQGPSVWTWVSTHETESEARTIAALEFMGSCIAHCTASAGTYTGRVAMARHKGQLQVKDLSLNAGD